MSDCVPGDGSCICARGTVGCEVRHFQDEAKTMIPAGSELDAAVAKAITWFPGHSTDAARIPSMLAWLNERRWRIELVQQYSGDGYSWHCHGFPPAMNHKHQSFSGCDTIQHGLALLVVAVAAREAS